MKRERAVPDPPANEKGEGLERREGDQQCKLCFGSEEAGHKWVLIQLPKSESSASLRRIFQEGQLESRRCADGSGFSPPLSITHRHAPPGPRPEKRRQCGTKHLAPTPPHSYNPPRLHSSPLLHLSMPSFQLLLPTSPTAASSPASLARPHKCPDEREGKRDEAPRAQQNSFLHSREREKETSLHYPPAIRDGAKCRGRIPLRQTAPSIILIQSTQNLPPSPLCTETEIIIAPY